MIQEKIPGTRKELITKATPTFRILGPGVPGRKVVVAEYTVPANTAVMLPNKTQLVMKLADGSGREISRDSYVYLYKKMSGFDGEQFIAKIPYAAYFDLSVGEQRNERYKDVTQVFFAVPKDFVIFGPDDRLQIWVESADEVDFTNAQTLFEIEVFTKQV